MSNYNIEIPHPVIEVEVDFEPAINDGERCMWFARIEVGGVVLMKRDYFADWPWGERPEAGAFAENADDARGLILAEFGAKLKALL